jgi:hypothetical protein
MKNLTERDWDIWVTILFDEWEDLAPMSESGFWSINLSVAGIQKEMRKNYVSSFYATHNPSEVFWSVLNKIPFTIYMRGSKPRKHSRIFPRVLNKLDTGSALIESNTWSEIRFEFKGEQLPIRAEINVRDTLPKND